MNKPYPIAQRQAIVQDAIDQIQQGARLEDIATKHSVSYRTLQYWLLAAGDDYKLIRQAHTDSMISNAMLDIADIEIPNRDDYEDVREMDSAVKAQSLRLTRATQVFKAVSWYAQSRDARYRQQSISVSVDNNPRIIDMQSLTDEQLRAVALITVDRETESVPGGGSSQDG